LRNIAWKNEVLERLKAKAVLPSQPVRDIDKMTLGQLFSSLRLSHLLTLIALLIAFTGLVCHDRHPATWEAVTVCRDV